MENSHGQVKPTQKFIRVSNFKKVQAEGVEGKIVINIRSQVSELGAINNGCPLIRDVKISVG